MENQRPFGRRVNPQRRPPRREAARDVAPPNEQAEFDEDPIEQTMPLPKKTKSSSLDDEAGNRSFNLPWRQLSLTATLCFGIASFVLPESVNDSVQWLLYALMAASLYAGFGRRRRVERRTD
jgi:hypothetical protein